MTREELREIWRRYKVSAVSSISIWAALTGILIVVGIAVVHSSAVNHFDQRVSTTVVAHRSPALDALMKAVTWLGSWVALVVTASVLLVLAVRKRLPWAAVLVAVVAWGGEAGGVALAKHVVQRQRPPEKLWLVATHGWSWPSGHTATAVLLFTVLAAVVTYLGPPKVTLAVTWSAALVAVALVAFSRIELGVHWSTDVIASALFVTAWLAVLGFTFRRPPGSGPSRALLRNRQIIPRSPPSDGAAPE
jgi:undecaprenyl-diphosphatase